MGIDLEEYAGRASSRAFNGLVGDIALIVAVIWYFGLWDSWQIVGIGIAVLGFVPPGASKWLVWAGAALIILEVIPPPA
jgi:hypothetical protein